MSDLTAEQNCALELLRAKVEDILLTSEQRNSNSHLLKWLIARDFDVGKAEQMLRAETALQYCECEFFFYWIPKSVLWRKKNDMTRILQWEPPEVLKRYYPVGILGSDNTGCPVLMIPVGRSDIRGLIETGGRDNFARYTFQVLEKCRVPPDGGEPTDQIVCVFDLEGFSLKHVTSKAVIDVTLEIVQDFENNYPEMLKAAYAINTPSVFKIMFNIIKPLLTMRTMKKIEMFGQDRSTWVSKLREIIPPDQLPQHWGGTKEGNDEFCSSAICMGGVIPKEYFSAPNNGKAEKGDGREAENCTTGASPDSVLKSLTSDEKELCAVTQT